MAEAVVEDRPQRFYCHSCNVQFTSVTTNFTCPHCSKGFIEVLEASTDGPTDFGENVDSDYEMFVSDFLSPSSRDDARTDPHRGRRRYASVNPRYRIIRPRTVRRIASRNVRQNTFENVIQDFLVNLADGISLGVGNMQFILGNPADYVWGREGLDTIVTQLLNQMDATGPPPLAQDIIDALPQVEITIEQVTSKLQCSVCWEDFVLKESVYQLPCLHVYHDSCIRPWLQLHGTCPICRQNLGENERSERGGSAEGGNDNTPYNTLQQLFHVVQNSGNIEASSSGSTTPFQSSSNTSTSTDGDVI